MKQLTSLAVAVAAVALLVLLFAAPVLTVAAADSSPRSLDGKGIFLAQKCNMCHAVPPGGIEATTRSESLKGPDLVNLKQDAEWLEKFLRKELELNGKAHKKEFKGSKEELDALVSWLLKQQVK